MKPPSSFRSSRSVLAGVLVAVAGAFGLAAWAGPSYGGGMIGLPLHGRMLERMLDGVNATDAQRTQIRQIAESAASDLASQRGAARSLKDQALALFTQPTVDANSAEALRKQMLSQHDAASQRMLQAMLEVSRVLTPEQRQKLADNLAKRRDMAARHQRERSQLDTGPTR